jgi:hypothetical protein
MIQPNYTEYPCPNCEESVPVEVPTSGHVVCPECKLNLEVHPDAEFDQDGWHDRTTLSIVPGQSDSTVILEPARA